MLGCPAIVAVQEVETRSLLEQLAEMLAGPCGFKYWIGHAPGPDARGIDVAMLLNPDVVTPQAIGALQSCTLLDTGIRDGMVSCPQPQDPLHSRPPLLVKTAIGHNRIAFLVVHLKSKRGGDAETSLLRLTQAQHIRNLVAELMNEDQPWQVVVLGDFNDYEQSAVAMMIGELLEDVLQRLAPEQRYSYIFSGASQLVDTIYLSPGLAEVVPRWQEEGDPPKRRVDRCFAKSEFGQIGSSNVHV